MFEWFTDPSLEETSVGEKSPTGWGGGNLVPPKTYQFAATAPQDRHRATVDKVHIVRVWDIATNRELVDFHGYRYTVQSVAFHPNGRQITGAGYGPPQRRHDRTWRNVRLGHSAA